MPGRQSPRPRNDTSITLTHFHATIVSDSAFSNGVGTTRSIIVQAHVNGALGQTREDLRPLYDLAFQTIRRQLPDVAKYSTLRVGLRLGYNLGIRKRYTTVFQDEHPTAGERTDAGSDSAF